MSIFDISKTNLQSFRRRYISRFGTVKMCFPKDHCFEVKFILHVNSQLYPYSNYNCSTTSNTPIPKYGNRDGACPPSTFPRTELTRKIPSRNTQIRNAANRKWERCSRIYAGRARLMHYTRTVAEITTTYAKPFGTSKLKRNCNHSICMNKESPVSKLKCNSLRGNNTNHHKDIDDESDGVGRPCHFFRFFF